MTDEKWTLAKRVEAYKETFAKWPASWPWLGPDERIYGMWILGNNYRGSGYYGSYPPNYLDRVMAMFGDKKKILHLFSGSLSKGNYTRFDIRMDVEADVRGDAHKLDEHFEANSFDLVVADPPYSEEDAERYGTPMISRSTVVKKVEKILCKGGHLVWLDQVLPMYRKAVTPMIGAIGLVRSTNHRFRITSIFEKI